MDVMRAAVVGDVDTVKKWLNDPRQTRLSTQVGFMLIQAAIHGNVNICQLMLDSGQVTDYGDVVDTLAFACAHNQLSTAQLLVRRRRFNTHDLTRALSHASLRGHERIVVWLMSDVIRLSQADRNTWLLTAACARGDMSDVQHYAAQVGTDVTRVTSHALRVACYRGRADVVKWLTSHTTADVSSLGEIHAVIDGEVTSLMAACIECNHGISRRLLECVTPHTVNMVSSRVHDTALHYTISSEITDHKQLTRASGEGDIDEVGSLLHSFKVDDQLTGGYTALHCACLNGHVEIVRLLLAVFARTDIADDRKRTPAMLAEVYGQTKVLPYLQMTLTESAATVTAVAVIDNNNGVSMSATSVDDVSKLANKKSNNSRFGSNPKQLANLPKSFKLV